MTDYRHELLFGAFLTPTAQDPAQVVTLTRLAEQVGLDLATFQDHPYQPGFLDTWTLLSYLAAATERIRLAANVLNLPLRQPAVIARSAASLDLLSGGRVELGLGAGAFWDAIEANGGRRLAPGQAVAALAEAIGIIREIWAADRRGGVRAAGEHYRVVGAKRGPAPAHDIGIWLGAYKPRMLRLTGRQADGWLPSLAYLPGGPTDLAGMNALIDEGAAEAGRDPAAIRRLLNIHGRFTATGGGLLTGPPRQWVAELAEIALTYGISGFILASDDPEMIRRYAREVAPGVRELVAAERARPTSRGADERDAPTPQDASTERDAPIERVHPTAGEADAPAFPVRPTPAPTTRLTDHRLWDESTRPVGPPAPAGFVYNSRARALGQHLVDVHDHLRRELAQVRDLLRQVRQGAMDPGRARAALNELTLRQHNWALGAYCASYCTMLTQHHTLEDSAVFPHLRRSDAGLAAVLDRLRDEHVVIHHVVEDVDRALVRLVDNPGDFREVQEAVDILTDTLLSHLSYEEEQLVEPLARYGFFRGQV